ncbi:exosortase C-terminal domain/associated protein EpsI [Geomonas edaphica]|uniref:exosortase C-terminal domain/associated protein EpsI n=1 Tax=Geomonas edaphica TaxID=2570226 RepID=UPI0010A923AE|nr:exosortase C-terminal domain/associated protein EpsI [Geomonas edaphica]
MIAKRTFIVTAALLLLTGVVVARVALRPAPVVLATNLENLPRQLGGYSGVDDRFPEEVYRVLNADMNLYRHYTDRSGNRLNLYIGYYGTAKGGRTGHNPYACLPGAGFAVVDTGTSLIGKVRSEGEVPVNYLRARNGGVSIVMLHWYQTAGNVVLDKGWKQNVERFWGRIARNRNDGAYVQVDMEAAEEAVPKTRQQLERFSEMVLDQLPRYWPVEK